jgi:peptidoglycan/xylan/chitin deacetylase (PgdA/CDA1 family)
MNRYLTLTTVLMLALHFQGQGQSRLIFSGTYEGTWHRFDSLVIEDLNTGSRIIKHYPDTVLKLLITGEEETPATSLRLRQNFPNPFPETTVFTLDLPAGGSVNLEVFNMAGQLVSGYHNSLGPGSHGFLFSGGFSGVYVVKARAGSLSASIRMVSTSAPGNAESHLEYSGSSTQPVRAPRSAGGFIFNTGDELSMTGYMTDLAGEVVKKVLTDAPERSKTYTIGFERKKRIVILMYHRLTSGVPADEYDRDSLTFENDMAYLQEQGYQVLSMNDLTLLKTGEMTLQSNGVIITFDDGYKSNISLAYPILSRRQMPATFFLVAEWIGTDGFSTWGDVWTMSQYTDSYGKLPFTMGSHTSSHPYLEKSIQYFATHEEYMNFLNTEIGDSKVWITDVTGQEQIFMSLPYGDGAYNADIIGTAQNLGYSGIRTSVWNSCSPEYMNLFALPSIPILSDSDIRIIENYLKY